MALPSRQDSEIWFLTGSQSLYGPETLEQVAENSQKIAELINANPSIKAKIVWKPVLLTQESIRRTLLDANSNDQCIGVITWMHTFSPSKMWIAGLQSIQKPILHFHTQANVTLPWSELDMDFMNLNQAAHGDREHGHIHARIDTARKIVVGHVSNPKVVERISNWVRACIGWNEAQNLKLARFGDNMRYVAVTDGDKTSAQMALGISIEAYGVNALVEAVDSVDPKQVDSLISEYEDLYEISPELRRGGDRHESLRYAAQIEAGLENFLTAGGFSAFTTNFEDLGGLKQLPGLAVQRLMAKGYGFGGEGDWKTSALLRIVKAMAASHAGGTSFMEDYTYHFGPGEPLVLGAHMLEVCPSITASKPKIEIHPLGIGDREDPVRMVFTATPARGFVVCITDMGDHFRMISNEIEIVEPDQPLPKLPVACAVWKPQPSLEASAESWIYAGGSHHTVLSTAVGVEVLQDFAEIAQIEYLEINSKTDVIDFRRQVRWNHAANKFK